MSIIKDYKLKNGETRYKFQLYVGIDELTGKEKHTTRRGFKTKKEARLALSRIQLEISNGTFRKKVLDTYQDVYNEWIKEYETTVAESTFVKTTGIFRNHILPKFGEYRIEKVDAKVCEKHVKEWKEKLKKFNMVKNYASLVLDHAVKEKIISKNVMKDVKVAKPKKDAIDLDNHEEEDKKLKFYTKDELQHFLECLEKESNFKAYALFRLLAFSGLRKQEALALTWSDINFTTNKISINKAISRGKESRLYLKTTKTVSSIRTIEMDPNTMDILKTWKKKQKQDYMALGFNTLNPKQLVFSNERNEFLQTTKPRKWLIQVQDKYNLKKITVHQFRHTHCSLMFESGRTVEYVKERLGHSDYKTTMNIYNHVTPKTKDESIDVFANYMNF